MNEHNPPMALPNGYVYGEKALLKMSQANKGLVTCSRSGDTFDFSEVKKVFVM
jgi:macrophage erythroblast attacher